MKPTSILCLFLLIFISHTNYAQTTVDDPEIKKMVAEVKSEKAEVLENAENLAAATDINMPIVNSELAEDDLTEE